MGVWRTAWEWLSATPTASFSESDPRPVDQVILEMSGRGVAPAVGRAEALSVPAVQRGRNLICSVATLPLVQRGPDRKVTANPLFEQLDPDVPNVVTLAQTVEDLVFEGIAWWRITAFGWDGYPTNVRRLDPGTVSLQPTSGRSSAPLPSGQDPRGAVVYVDGRPVPASEMIRFDSPNPAVLKVGGRAIRRAILLDRAASMYADDPQPAAYFTPAEGADPADDDDVRDMLADWKRARKERSTAYVPAALKYNGVPAPSPRDLQLAELQKQAGLEIANAFGVDPEDLGVSTTSRTYANVIDRRRDRINDVLAPYMRAITDRLSMGDVTRRGYRVAFQLDDYLKSNPTERWSVYKTQHELFGDAVLPEIREAEGWAALPAGAAEPAPEPVDQPEPAVEPEQVDASTRPALTLDDPSVLTFDAEVVEFSVNPSARTIEGLALPYGKVGRKGGMAFRFERGALQWKDPGRVKLLIRHDHTQAVGRAVELTDTPAGLRVKFQVARGAAGDEALSLAEDGVLDGLSPGVDFDMSADTTPDTRNKGAVLVRRADLREVSLTPMPVFDDSRVSKVAASRTEGDPVSESTTEPTPAPAAPAVVPAAGQTFSAETVGQLLAALHTPTAQAVPEQRQTVNPVRLTASTEVTDPQPYRFDRTGNIRPGSHEFSGDLLAASKGDQAAADRAMGFMRQQFDATNTTDTAGLNPNTQRPDMYVDQLSYRYPVWEAISKGGLSDIKPFVFPKYSSSSGLVGAHTEGTEPTVGDMVWTTQTVTPSAISGKAEINREVFDMGGNPQTSNLIWRQMVKGWYESLEAAAVAALDAVTPTGIALTAGGGTTGQTLDSELTAAFAALHYVRGGFSMTDMFTQIDLYKALVAAKDTTGRRLYPALGPSNASGTVSSKFAAIDVNGVQALPAWALAATGSVVASSYLFDREVVHGWASAPQELRFDYQVKSVFIGIWGYKATAISDINGVREVTYDPVP